ncbi:MAG: phosphate signaling complex protein PhoU [Mycobacteriaceae bacterium]
MRSTCGAQLAVLTDQLAEMCRLSGIAIERATIALLNADLTMAEKVITEHREIVSAGAKVEETGFALLTQQAPVARDLRATVSSIQIVADIERMGTLALHVAEIARLRHPRPVLPEDVTGYFAQMGRIASDLASNAFQVIVSCDLGRARYIREADDAMDDLHRHLFTVMMDPEWPHWTAVAVDVTLLGRYYERFADHAVEISRRIIFQATGDVRSEERILNH